MSKSNGNDPSRQDKTSRRRRSSSERTGPAFEPIDPALYPSHPYASMERFARLLHEHYGRDPAGLDEARVRDYFLHVKLIYCAGLRLSECLRLNVHEVDGTGRKLWIRDGKGGRDRMVPLSEEVLEDLRGYWKFHRNAHWLFPNVGRGPARDPALVAERMHRAKAPMPVSSLQRLVVAARGEIGVPKVPPTPCVIPSPRTWWRPEQACTRSSTSSAIRTSIPRWSTST